MTNLPFSIQPVIMTYFLVLFILPLSLVGSDMPPSSYYKAPTVHDLGSERGNPGSPHAYQGFRESPGSHHAYRGFQESPASHRVYQGFRESPGSLHTPPDFPSAPLYFFYPGFHPQAFNPGMRSGYVHPGSTQGYHLGHLSGPQMYPGSSLGFSFVPPSGHSQQRIETPQTNKEKLVLFVKDEKAKVDSGEMSKISQEIQVATMRVRPNPTANAADGSAKTKIDAKPDDGDVQSDSSEKSAMEDRGGKKENGEVKMKIVPRLRKKDQKNKERRLNQKQTLRPEIKMEDKRKRIFSRIFQRRTSMMPRENFQDVRHEPGRIEMVGNESIREMSREIEPLLKIKMESSKEKTQESEAKPKSKSEEEESASTESDTEKYERKKATVVDYLMEIIAAGGEKRDRFFQQIEKFLQEYDRSPKGDERVESSENFAVISTEKATKDATRFNQMDPKTDDDRRDEFHPMKILRVPAESVEEGMNDAKDSSPEDPSNGREFMSTLFRETVKIRDDGSGKEEKRCEDQEEHSLEKDVRKEPSKMNLEAATLPSSQEKSEENPEILHPALLSAEEWATVVQMMMSRSEDESPASTDSPFRVLRCEFMDTESHGDVMVVKFLTQDSPNDPRMVIFRMPESGEAFGSRTGGSKERESGVLERVAMINRGYLEKMGSRKGPGGVSRSTTTYLRRTEDPFIGRKGSRRQNLNAFRSSSSRPVANLQGEGPHRQEFARTVAEVEEKDLKQVQQVILEPNGTLRLLRSSGQPEGFQVPQAFLSHP